MADLDFPHHQPGDAKIQFRVGAVQGREVDGIVAPIPGTALGRRRLGRFRLFRWQVGVEVELAQFEGRLDERLTATLIERDITFPGNGIEGELRIAEGNNLTLHVQVPGNFKRPQAGSGSVKRRTGPGGEFPYRRHIQIDAPLHRDALAAGNAALK